MDTSYQYIDRSNASSVSNQALVHSNSTHQYGYLAVALGIIVLLGSLVATGCLYSQMGYASCAIGASGAVFGIICFLLSRYCCSRAVKATDGVPSSQHSQLETTQPIEETHLTDTDVHPGRSPVKPPRAAKTHHDLASPGRATTKNEETNLNTPPTDLNPNPLVPSTEFETPTLSPLPHILNLKLEESNPLLKEIPTNSFLKKKLDIMSMILGSQFVKNAGREQVYGDSVIDDELLNIPLYFWINRKVQKDTITNHLYAANHLEVMNDPTRLQQKEVINSRIEALNQAIQFKERLERLKYLDLKVRDLLPALNDRLKLMLLMDDELCALKVSSIDQMDNHLVWDLIGSRIRELSQKREDFAIPLDLTQENVGEIPLIALPHLKAQQVHLCPANFPPITFLLIDRLELQQITTNLLSTHQLQFLFNSTYYHFTVHHYVESLKPDQINACIPLIKNKELFANLNEEQAIQFDDSQMDQEIFNAIFDLSGELYSKAARLFKKITLDRIYVLSPFFSDDHWKHIGNEHTLAFDFSQIEESKRQKVFNILFDTEGGTFSKAAKYLNKLSPTQIAILRPYLYPEALKYLK